VSKSQGTPGASRQHHNPLPRRDYVPTGQFPKSQRLRKRAEFQRVQNEGRVVKTAHLVVVLDAASSGDCSARLGITASRKVGNAVLRNRAKRVVRSAFRATRELWPPGIDVVIIVRRFESEMTTPELARELVAVRDHIGRRARQCQAETSPREPTC
jgi:ribonuclease P protein component